MMFDMYIYIYKYINTFDVITIYTHLMMFDMYIYKYINTFAVIIIYTHLMMFDMYIYIHLMFQFYICI